MPGNRVRKDSRALEHASYAVLSEKWVSACDLKRGDKVLLSDGTLCEVESVTLKALESPETTYNLEVADFHTYYVSDACVLVHNSCRSDAVKKAWKQEREMVARTGRGTRNWNSKQKMELLRTGRVKGFEGHHINSVKGSPNLAGDPNNIRFVTRREHLALHHGNFRNITHGKLLSRLFS